MKPEAKPSIRKQIRQTVRLLNILAQPPDGLKVKVSVVKRLPRDRLGDCSKHAEHYAIRLSAEIVDKQPDAVWMLLAHEWAHALTWDNCTHNHGQAWGMALAKAWRIISGEISPGDIVDELA